MERQKVTDYRPTLAERKLLEVLLNPELRTATVTDICQRAGQLTAGKNRTPSLANPGGYPAIHFR